MLRNLRFALIMSQDKEPQPGSESEPVAPRDARAGRPWLLLEAAKEYCRMVTRWFRHSEQALSEKKREFLTQADLGSPRVKDEIAAITDLVQSLRSDQNRIYDGLRRGADPRRPAKRSGERTEERNAAVLEALIGIDHSIAAWLRLKESFPDQTDDILTLLLQLDRLRKSAEAEFPGARAAARTAGGTREES